MNIVDALLNDDCMLRVSCGNRWLVGGVGDTKWTVYEHKPYAKKVQIVYEGNNEEAAVDKLLDG
jgi:hypothetical protein